MDGLNTWGRTKDMVIIGLGNSTLDDVTPRRAERAWPRGCRPTPNPKRDTSIVPTISNSPNRACRLSIADAGTDYIGKPAGYGKEKRDYYTEHDYHKPSDEVKPDWDLSGAVEDLRVFFEIGDQRGAG